MKNYLAVDTSSGYLTVLAYLNQKKYVRHDPDCAMRQSVLIMPAVDSLLKEAGATLSDFDFFSCVVGAGSFTGIRIGISVVKGFCLATGKACLPVTSFELSAYTEKDGKRLVLVNALHDAYYASAYDGDEQTLAPSYLTADEVREYEKKGYRPLSLEKLPIPSTLVSPVEGLFNAVEKKCGEKDAFKEPVALYVRKSQAEVDLDRGVNK